MSAQRKYRCRKCGVEVLAGPYIAPELCSACQLAANAKRPESTSEITPEMIYRVAELHRTIKEQAAEIERLKAEIERLKKACELYRQASIQSHKGHWDPTRKGGAGCPECNRAAQLRSEAETFLKEEDTHEIA